MSIHKSLKYFAKRLSLYIFCFLYSGVIYSQQKTDDLFYSDDSISMEGIRLKPEVWEAIQSGTLINPRVYSDNEIKQNAVDLLQIVTDFKQYIQLSDTIQKKIDFEKIPPGVFLLYNLNVEYTPFNLKSFNLVGIENYEPDRPQPILITDPLMKGGASGGLRYMVNINNLINYYILKKKTGY